MVRPGRMGQNSKSLPIAVGRSPAIDINLITRPQTPDLCQGDGRVYPVSHVRRPFRGVTVGLEGPTCGQINSCRSPGTLAEEGSLRDPTAVSLLSSLKGSGIASEHR